MLAPSPQWLDSGNNAWQLAAATFVGLQSIPGLAVLYAGYVKQKWAINSAFMCFYAFASVLVVWVLFDYNMAFGEQWFPFLGKPALATSASFTTGQATIPAAAAVPASNIGGICQNGGAAPLAQACAKIKAKNAKTGVYAKMPRLTRLMAHPIQGSAEW